MYIKFWQIHSPCSVGCLVHVSSLVLSLSSDSCPSNTLGVGSYVSPVSCLCFFRRSYIFTWSGRMIVGSYCSCLSLFKLSSLSESVMRFASLDSFVRVFIFNVVADVCPVILLSGWASISIGCPLMQGCLSIGIHEPGGSFFCGLINCPAFGFVNSVLYCPKCSISSENGLSM